MKNTARIGFRWICSWAMTACRRRCACRNPRIDFLAARAPQCRREEEKSRMKSTLTQVVLGGALLLGVYSLKAQEPPPEPPPAADFALPPRFAGPRMEILGFGEMHPGKVVTNAPYSAVGVTETKQTLQDGNSIDRKVSSNIYRDSQGRTRRETTFPGVGPLTASGQPRSVVMIHDPVASTGYVLHPDTKVAEQLPSPPGGSKRGGGLQGKFEARIQQEIANGTLKKEDLGTQTIDGVSA